MTAINRSRTSWSERAISSNSARKSSSDPAPPHPDSTRANTENTSENRLTRFEDLSRGSFTPEGYIDYALSRWRRAAAPFVQTTEERALRRELSTVELKNPAEGEKPRAELHRPELPGTKRRGGFRRERIR